MRRVAFAERPDWRNILLDAGFPPDAPPGRPQWAEDSCWVIGHDEAHGLAAAAIAVERRCREAVDQATRSEASLDRLRIPEFMRDMVVDSWRAGQPSLLGRIDLDPAGRLLGLDADT
ncbi:MAG: glutathionylspermidine synthase family protein, partial [Alphaproteobacteria bacterium]|nr:glutathionylspermidine synthase family protein [Alphaproteobacteria bacterium]